MNFFSVSFEEVCAILHSRLRINFPPLFFSGCVYYFLYLTFTWPVKPKGVLDRLFYKWCLVKLQKCSDSALFTYDYLHALG